jgi:dTDP-4-dehydrorhamnose reductase
MSITNVKRMNILVTGSNGQLGNELRKISGNHPTYRFFFTDVAELDITNPGAVIDFFEENRIQTVINCAAYTAVDKAEGDESAATRINATAVGYLAKACDQAAATLIHISTDYVYDGCACKPYREDHYTAPASAYGRSKLAGEEAALSTPRSVVIRTSWLYSSFGNNFVQTMIRLGKERETLNVVFDQVGTPTYAADLAQAIMTVAGRAEQNTLKRGIFHYSNEGVCSWYDFAREIMQQAGLKCTVKPIETKDYPAPAPRPHYSVLNKARIKAAYGIEIPHWKDSLARCLYPSSGIFSISDEQ